MAIKKDPYPLPFTDEVINTIIGHEVYTFMDRFSKYHHISITPKDLHKITFVIDWGGFVWVVMPFGAKNGPPTYQKAITKAFHEYIHVFMKIFLDDFIAFNDLLTHLEKLKKCFLKCKKFGVSLNRNNCTFMVFSRTILSFIISKEGKVMDSKKVEALENMPVPTTPQVFNGMAQFYKCFIKNFASTMSPITKLFQKSKVLVDYIMPKCLGGD